MVENTTMNSEIPNNDATGISNRELADKVINKFASKSAPKANNKRSAPPSKDDDEYSKKRQRNNVAVKKSREKTKDRIKKTQVRVEQLTKENEELQTKVNLLSKELNVLRALFTNGGFTLPVDLQFANNNSSAPSEHSTSMSYSPHSRLSSGDEAVLSSSNLHAPYEAPEKYRPYEDTKSSSKIPPLRPTPRIPSTSPSHHTHSMIHHHNSMKSFPPRPEHQMYTKSEYLPPKDTKSGPPLLIQTNVESIGSSLHMPQQNKGDTRHPSVIRSTTDISDQNALKFRRMQDDKNLKILPLNS